MIGTATSETQALNTSGIGRGWDVHVYFDLTADSIATVQKLHLNLQKEFPNLCVFPLVGRPVGPHTKPMFQAVVVNAAEFGAAVSWIALNRAGLSVLVHPHTGNALDDHLKYPIWIGEQLPIRKEVLMPH
ncbi:aromatic ring-cleaving dioxygenase [Obelidium mucronatum]|nr:aromatic ring-cleaving dioxygenase [Obelidium mucronatum]